MSGVVLGDFCPFNTWVPDENGSTWFVKGQWEPKNLIDQTTGRRYFNEDPWCVRTKCILLSLGTPIVHAVASLVNLAYRIAKFVGVLQFFDPEEKAWEWEDAIRIVTTPVAFLGLECAALFGILFPYEGRKLYATIERAQYGDFVLAPCFQPEAESHLFGGNINKPNAW